LALAHFQMITPALIHRWLPQAAGNQLGLKAHIGRLHDKADPERTMAMKAPRWTTVSESQYPWEREAIEFLREHLPERDPWQAWSNFEFIDDDGKVNEVDALVLSPFGLFLLEIKSRPGELDGDAHT